jgi:hypothetical protein
VYEVHAIHTISVIIYGPISVKSILHVYIYDLNRICYLQVSRAVPDTFTPASLSRIFIGFYLTFNLFLRRFEASERDSRLQELSIN